MKDHLTFWFTRSPWNRGRILFLIGNTVEDCLVRRHHVGKITFEEREEGVVVPDSDGLHLTDDNAQQMMDALWNVGIRPTEGVGSAGSLAATIRHLEDMRALVFKKE